MKHDEIMYKMASLAQYETQEMEKSAFVPGLVGALVSADLPKDDAKLLREYYGLDPNEGLKSRAIGRSALRGVMGGSLGALIGAPYGLYGSVPLGLTGSIVGDALGALKYSKKNAYRIRQELARRNKQS